MQKSFYLLFFLFIVAIADIDFNQETAWFDQQRIDHFDPLNNTKWSQRYFVIADYFNPKNGPIFLYICGEATCLGVKHGKAYIVEMAKQLGALVLTLEHRYYGSSWPLGIQSETDLNLKYLSVEQAMADLAQFTQYIKDNQLYGVTSENPWISIGGSYAGAVSSWYRMKYPHMTIGAIGSSGVINAIYNFTNFDRQIRISTLKSSLTCANKIASANQYVQSQVYVDDTARIQFQKRFGDNATHLNKEEFLFYFADIFAEQVQYGNRTILCNAIEGLSDDEAVVNWAIAQQSDPTSYGQYFLSQTTVLYDTDTGRSWEYQICTEFGWFQPAPTNDGTSMRGTNLKLAAFLIQCMESFSSLDLEDSWNRPNLINYRYGGLNMSATNLIVTNGNEDPWQWASTNSSKKGIQVYYVQGDDVGHCFDLHSTNLDTDPQTLIDVRKIELQSITNWIQQYWEKVQVQKTLQLQQEKEERQRTSTRNNLIIQQQLSSY